MNCSFLTVYYYHVMCAFHSESTLCSCQSIKELLARNRTDIRTLNDSNGIRTHNRLVLKRTLNHEAKRPSVRLQTKWLWVRIPLLFIVEWKKSFIYTYVLLDLSLVFTQTLLFCFFLTCISWKLVQLLLLLQLVFHSFFLNS